MDVTDLGELDLQMQGTNGTYYVRVPAESMRANRQRTAASYTSGAVAVTIGGSSRTQTYITLRSTDAAALSALGDNIMVRLTLPGYSAGGQMVCLTHSYSSKDVTNCSPRQEGASRFGLGR
jgi:hypothetical protein